MKIVKNIMLGLVYLCLLTVVTVGGMCLYIVNPTMLSLLGSILLIAFLIYTIRHD